jgi:hypothetical protein
MRRLCTDSSRFLDRCRSRPYPHEVCLTCIRVTVSAFMTSPDAPKVVTPVVIRQKSAEGIVIPPWRDEGPNEEVSGGFHGLGKGDESDRGSHSPARHGDSPLNPVCIVDWIQYPVTARWLLRTATCGVSMRGGEKRDGERPSLTQLGISQFFRISGRPPTVAFCTSS